MKPLDNLTISQRLLIPSAIVVVGFIAIMRVYENGESLRQEVADEQQQAADFYNATVELDVLALRAVNDEKFFLMRNDITYEPLAKVFKPAELSL